MLTGSSIRPFLVCTSDSFARVISCMRFISSGGGLVWFNIEAIFEKYLPVALHVLRALLLCLFPFFVSTVTASNFGGFHAILRLYSVMSQYFLHVRRFARRDRLDAGFLLSLLRCGVNLANSFSSLCSIPLIC